MGSAPDGGTATGLARAISAARRLSPR
jgi:hypothetical protein